RPRGLHAVEAETRDHRGEITARFLDCGPVHVMPAQIGVLYHVLGFRARAEHAVGKSGQRAPMCHEIRHVSWTSHSRHVAAVLVLTVFGPVRSRSTGLVSPPITTLVQARPWPRAYFNVGYVRAESMAKARDIKPRLPQRSKISSRKSSASGAWCKVASVKRADRATSSGIATQSRATIARRMAGSTPWRCAISMPSWVHGPQSSDITAMSPAAQ